MRCVHALDEKVAYFLSAHQNNVLIDLQLPLSFLRMIKISIWRFDQSLSQPLCKASLQLHFRWSKYSVHTCHLQHIVSLLCALALAFRNIYACIHMRRCLSWILRYLFIGIEHLACFIARLHKNLPVIYEEHLVLHYWWGLLQPHESLQWFALNISTILITLSCWLPPLSRCWSHSPNVLHVCTRCALCHAKMTWKRTDMSW